MIDCVVGGGMGAILIESLATNGIYFPYGALGGLTFEFPFTKLIFKVFVF